MIRFGVYGYGCSIITDFNDFRLIPIKNKDQKQYSLTAFLEIINEQNLNYRQLIYDLESVLSFIEKKDIIITNQLSNEYEYNDLPENYPLKIRDELKNKSSPTIISDSISRDSRKNFIQMALNKLKDQSDPNNKIFRGAFFRIIEVYRMRGDYVDISYYLLFSALESLSREVLNNDSKNCSEPISKFLQDYGFDVRENYAGNLLKSISSYAHVRSSLFHNGKLEKTINQNNQSVTYSLFTYHKPLALLLPLVIIKYIGFDDDYINWNSWLDRMDFQGN